MPVCCCCAALLFFFAVGRCDGVPAINFIQLVFYKDKPKAEGERFVGVISLDAVVSILPDEDAPRAHSFTIHGETTEWKLAAESEGEEQLWIWYVNACCFV